MQWIYVIKAFYGMFGIENELCAFINVLQGYSKEFDYVTIYRGKKYELYFIVLHFFKHIVIKYTIKSPERRLPNSAYLCLSDTFKFQTPVYLRIFISK